MKAWLPALLLGLTLTTAGQAVAQVAPSTTPVA
jgi:hypothetical protein